MVGEVSSRSIEINDLEHWLPIDVLLLLTIATGLEISTPWIEFRDSSGRLVRRLHIGQYSLPAFPRAYRGIIDEGFHRSTGRLLTQALASPELDTLLVRTTLRLLTRSRTDGLFGEERLDLLVRALDMFCGQEGVQQQQLINSLVGEAQQKVRQILSNTSKDIQQLAKEAAANGDSQQHRILQQIAGRVLNAGAKDSKFGESVVMLLRKLGFLDADILDAYYQQYPRQDGKSWPDIVSYYRNTATHSGYFDFASDHQYEEDVAVLVSHLYDILVRIILSRLNYDGAYQPPMLDTPMLAHVDWVKPHTPASQLGYPMPVSPLEVVRELPNDSPNDEDQHNHE